MSWRVTISATREQAEVAGALDEPFPLSSDQPVLVADEPDPAKPDEWLIHAYFERRPDDSDLDRLAMLGRGTPQIEQLGEDDWVTMSQAGLEPVEAGRFHVHTPTHPPVADAINFEIDAGLAFGTGQHATTMGCLAALDRLEQGGARFANIADIGTGTGLLAFAALALWPDAKAIATDIDPVSIDVTVDNAAINRVPVGHGPGELLLSVADGMDHPLLEARAPFDLIIANILAAPLILLAPAFTKAAAAGATLVLAGLLDSQAEAVIASYEAFGCSLVDGGDGEWRVLVFKR
ncbi:MAG: 50S ribosomal protein L11 methyltransferase [Sphingomonas sp.]|nr:50S ribosomal protein L11 methyltransferase [Sphingomonas sp.]